MSKLHTIGEKIAGQVFGVSYCTECGGRLRGVATFWFDATRCELRRVEGKFQKYQCEACGRDYSAYEACRE